MQVDEVQHLARGVDGDAADADLAGLAERVDVCRVHDAGGRGELAICVCQVAAEVHAEIVLDVEPAFYRARARVTGTRGVDRVRHAIDRAEAVVFQTRKTLVGGRGVERVVCPVEGDAVDGTHLGEARVDGALAIVAEGRRGKPLRHVDRNVPVCGGERRLQAELFVRRAARRENRHRGRRVARVVLLTREDREVDVFCACLHELHARVVRRRGKAVTEASRQLGELDAQRCRGRYPGVERHGVGAVVLAECATDRGTSRVVCRHAYPAHRQVVCDTRGRIVAAVEDTVAGEVFVDGAAYAPRRSGGWRGAKQTEGTDDERERARRGKQSFAGRVRPLSLEGFAVTP